MSYTRATVIKERLAVKDQSQFSLQSLALAYSINDKFLHICRHLIPVSVK